MTNEQIIRAWRDEEYRRSLSAAELAQLPEHPAGLMQLSDEDLSATQGGATWTLTITARSTNLCWRSIRYCSAVACPSPRTFLFFC
jgi:mersacidin/lichenicidin family type 2 lantibiotic